MLSQPALPPLHPETATVEHTVIAVNVFDQGVLNCIPVAPQAVEVSGVDRRAIPLDYSGGSHESSADQGARQIETREHGREQSLQCQHIALAVLEDGRAIVGGPWTARQDARAKVLLLGDADAIDPEE